MYINDCMNCVWQYYMIDDVVQPNSTEKTGKCECIRATREIDVCLSIYYV